jgi:methyltransferase (TIGR00027 family)
MLINGTFEKGDLFMVKKKRIVVVIIYLLLFVFVAAIMNVIAVEPGKISGTARRTAIYRAIGALEPDEKVRNNDTFAEKFVPRSLWARIFPNINFSRGYEFAIYLIKFDGRLGYFYVNARSKHIDAILSNSLTNKVKQVVNLGAGYDSRAYRFHQIAPEVRYFEIDLPEMIADKKLRVKEILGALPDWVSYVPIDFNKQTLSEELIKAGYDKNKRTLFIWEGVTMYLSNEAVTSTLQFVANQSLPGSSIVFDYTPYSIDQINKYKQTNKGGYSWEEMPGEPITYGIEGDKLETFLGQLGLKLVSDLGSFELADKYHLILSGYVYESGRIAYAIVRGSD